MNNLNLIISINILYLQTAPFMIPPWELTTDFDPVQAASECRSPRLIDCGGNPIQHPFPTNDVIFTDPQLDESWESLLQKLALLDCDHFVAGLLHDHPQDWVELLRQVNNEHSEEVKNWILNKIDVQDFIVPFKGNYGGKHYDCQSPPRVQFQNYSGCEQYKFEIARQLEERIRNGSMEVIGKVGEVEAPHLVLPLVMVEGKKKNRLCHDDRFLNLFMKHMPFSLEGLSKLPAIIEEGECVASTDEKSAYDGLLLSETSRTYFGLQFGGFYMQYKTLPFGWSLSPYIFQTVGMQVTQFLRLKGVTTLQYLDDRLLGPKINTPGDDPIVKTGYSIYLNAATLTQLGYTIERHKSILHPSLYIKWLGLNVDTSNRQFSIPQDKKVAFKALREQIMSQDKVHINLLQKFMGKCMSFTLCFPMARLYIREMAIAIGAAQKASRPIRVRGDLADEILFWEFVDNLEGGYKWKEERHVDLEIATDASGFAWGASIADEEIIHDRWSKEDRRPIHMKETEALINTLDSIPDRMRNRRVDVKVDNQALIKAWERNGAKNKDLNDLLKVLFTKVTALNCELHLSYISTSENPADAPSRRSSLADAKLSDLSWEKVERLYGPHSFDLMSLDSNVMVDKKGVSLPHFTPWPLPQSSGVNIFCQTLDHKANYYCFPPFCMVPAVLNFLLRDCSAPLRVTLIVPKLSPLPSWWPKLVNSAQISCLALTGDDKAVEAPSLHGYEPFKLKCDLMVARIIINS